MKRNLTGLINLGLTTSLLILFLTLPVLSKTSDKTISANTKFTNGLWFNGETFKPLTAYSIDGKLTFKFKGKIDSTVDLQESYIIPPFAEAHTHQFLDITFLGANYKNLIDEYLNKGIFYVKNLNSLPRFTILIRPYINIPSSIDIAYANGGLTASGGHPTNLFDNLAKNNIFPDLTVADMPNQAYFIIDDEKDLNAKWQTIKNGKPDIIKVYLEHSEEYEIRKNDEKFVGRRGLNPELLPKIVAKAHADNLRVSAHISSAQDFRSAVAAGVDELAHLPLELLSESDALSAKKKKIFVVTATLSHREAPKNIDEINRQNLKILYKAGVKIAFGTDNMPVTVVDEAQNIKRLDVFDNLTLLKIWTENTPQTIFPNRKIGFLKEGYEATFLALKGNPIEDFSNVQNITFRFKQGYAIKTER